MNSKKNNQKGGNCIGNTTTNSNLVTPSNIINLTSEYGFVQVFYTLRRHAIKHMDDLNLLCIKKSYTILSILINFIYENGTTNDGHKLIDIILNPELFDIYLHKQFKINNKKEQREHEKNKEKKVYKPSSYGNIIITIGATLGHDFFVGMTAELQNKNDLKIFAMGILDEKYQYKYWSHPGKIATNQEHPNYHKYNNFIK